MHNFYVFCGSCHHDFDSALRGFWGDQPLPYEFAQLDIKHAAGIASDMLDLDDAAA